MKHAVTQTTKAVAAVAVAALATYAAYSFLLFGIRKEESCECQTWKAEAAVRPGYFLTEWQAAQCAAHGIEIEAPVIKSRN